MQQMQYDAPNRMYVFQNFSGGDISPFGAGTQNLVPSPPKSWLRAWRLPPRISEIINSVVGLIITTTNRSNYKQRNEVSVSKWTQRKINVT